MSEIIEIETIDELTTTAQMEEEPWLYIKVNLKEALADWNKKKMEALDRKRARFKAIIEYCRTHLHR